MLSSIITVVCVVMLVVHLLIHGAILLDDIIRNGRPQWVRVVQLYTEIISWKLINNPFKHASLDHIHIRKCTVMCTFK